MIRGRASALNRSTQAFSCSSWQGKAELLIVLWLISRHLRWRQKPSRGLRRDRALGGGDDQLGELHQPTTVGQLEVAALPGGDALAIGGADLAAAGIVRAVGRHLFLDIKERIFLLFFRRGRFAEFDLPDHDGRSACLGNAGSDHRIDHRVDGRALGRGDRSGGGRCGDGIAGEGRGGGEGNQARGDEEAAHGQLQGERGLRCPVQECD